ncbi:cache domain-containing protein [Poseidonocella sp. HB161398]|uniref:cache domain-containing protein n=1 Tax=Poseidonocella sp. HB161398 TaxID=2320855 RepID=UPI0011099BA2|nr:cache domain-containing protein [Poseidonocella sp. HB161398]
MRKSLGVVLALALAGLQLVAVTFVVFSSYFTSERTLLAHARSQLVDVGVNVIQNASWFLSPARGASELSTALAENRIVRREEVGDLEGLLFQQLRTAPQFAGAYYGDEEGNFLYVMRRGEDRYLTKIIDADAPAATRTELIRRSGDFSELDRRFDPLDDYDPRTRPWYQSARAELHSIWTDPYIFFTSQVPGITAATPVEGAGHNVQGVIGVDIEIDELSRFLAKLQIGVTGAAYVLNRNGDVIAHPNPALLKTVGAAGDLRFPSIRTIDDPLARAAFGNRPIENGIDFETRIESDFEYGGLQYVSLIMPFGLDDIPWTIVVYAPENDFIGTLKKNRAQNTLIAIGIAAITAVIGLALANRIYAPVRAFAVRSALISQGEISPDEPMPETYRELEDANTALVNQIRQRKKTETEYRMTFELASRGVAYIDGASGRILRVNTRFAEILGHGTEELEGRPFQSLLAADETDLLARVGANTEKHHAFSFEARALRRDRAAVWIRLNGICFDDASGGSGYILATIDDITKVRESEEKIEKLNQEIALVSRQQLMGELATGLAHELNQPLTAITQDVDAALFLVENWPERTCEIRELLTEIDQYAHQAGDIIRALRALIRKDATSATDFGIFELLEQAKRLIQTEARQNGLEISVSGGAEIGVHADRAQIGQVVVNLLRNAVEAISAGDCAERQIRVSARIAGDLAEVTVEDTGPGIAANFDPFVQFESTKPDGLGLGLSLSRSLVEANGGTIWHDAAKQGGCFTFTLPRKGLSA